MLAPSASLPAGVAGIYYEVSYVPDNQEYAHRLELYDDLTFVLWVNLGVGMGEVTGGYSQRDGEIDCVVGQVLFSGFAGDDVTAFSFTVVDEKQLEYHGPSLAYLEDGNRFEKDRF